MVLNFIRKLYVKQFQSWSESFTTIYVFLTKKRMDSITPIIDFQNNSLQNISIAGLNYLKYTFGFSILNVCVGGHYVLLFALYKFAWIAAVSELSAAISNINIDKMPHLEAKYIFIKIPNFYFIFNIIQNVKINLGLFRLSQTTKKKYFPTTCQDAMTLILNFFKFIKLFHTQG